MAKTSIEWTDFSVNPIRARLNGKVGHHCEKVSAGCKNCYSSRLQLRFGLPVFDASKRQSVEHFLDASKLEQVLRRKTPTKWFWCDMTDMFGDWVPDAWVAVCFGVMAATPWHTHQVLTKRPERARKWFAWIAEQPVSLGGPRVNAGRGVRWHAWNTAIDGVARDRRWRPSLLMPKWMARAWLLVTGVRRERLQDITEADALDEGTPCYVCGQPILATNDDDCACFHGHGARVSYEVLWDELNPSPGRRWADNPEVTVYMFERDFWR